MLKALSSAKWFWNVLQITEYVDLYCFQVVSGSIILSVTHFVPESFLSPAFLRKKPQFAHVLIKVHVRSYGL